MNEIAAKARFRRFGAGVAALSMVVLGAGCGSNGGKLPADAAEGLAVRAEAVAAALEAGGCEQAKAAAGALEAAVTGLSGDPAIQAEAMQRAHSLADAIQCVSTTTTTTPTTTTAVPTIVARDGARPEKGKKHKGDDHDD